MWRNEEETDREGKGKKKDVSKAERIFVLVQYLRSLPFCYSSSLPYDCPSVCL